MDRKLMVACGAVSLLLAASSANANLIVNGNFSAGNTGFGTGYTLTTMTPYLFENGVHGIYAVIPASQIAGSAQYGDWTNISRDPTGGNGNVFVADGATDANTTVWTETVNVTANTLYRFSFYGAEVSNACCSNAVFQPTIDGTNGTQLSTSGSWQQDVFTWNSGSNTTATLSLVDVNTDGSFNDFALDDFSLTPAAVPEPGTLALLGTALTGLAGWRRRRKAKKPA